MRKTVVAFLVLLLPVLLCANVLQVFRYQRLEQELTALQEQQAELIEQNKRAILAISILTSPDRIGQIAEDELDLQLIQPEEIQTLLPGGSGAGQ